MKQFVVLGSVLAATLSAPIVAQERNIGGDALGGAARGAIIGGIAGTNVWLRIISKLDYSKIVS